MTDKIRIAAHTLGELIKDDPVTIALNAALDEYERSEDITALIGEYNAVQEAAITAEGEEKDKLADRLNELYEEITSHPVYAGYINAKAAFDALYSEVMGEVEFAITGEHPCTHDCSTCGGCH